MTVPETQQKNIKIALAGLTFFDYCKIVDSEDFYNEEYAPYLKEICDALQEFETDDNDAIIITEPPRHRKNKNSRK